MLGRSVIPPRNQEFWNYHRRNVRAMGYSLSYTRIALNAAFRVLDLVGNPKRTIENVIQRIMEREKRKARPNLLRGWHRQLQ